MNQDIENDNDVFASMKSIFGLPPEDGFIPCRICGNHLCREDLSLLDVRKTNVASKHTHVDGAGTQFKGMKEDLDKVLATSEKQRRNLTSKQAYKIARNQLLKSRAGLVLGGGLTAYSLYQTIKDIFGDEKKENNENYF